MRTWAALPIALLWLAASIGGALGDEWPMPPQRYPSADGRFALVRDTPRAGMISLQQIGTGATARWAVRSPDPGKIVRTSSAPVAVYISDDGEHVVLRDQWHEVGYGNVLTFLGPQGQVLASYTVEQLLGKHEIMEAKLTISSLWWSEDGLFFIRRGQRQFAFVTQWGTIGLFDLATGKRLTPTEGQRRGVRLEAVPMARRALASDDPDQRVTGAIQSGALGDRTAVAKLKQLLSDPASGTIVVGDVRSTEYRVQLAAGRALVMLLGKDAVPLLEPKLEGANSYMARQWRYLIEQAARPAPQRLRLFG